MIKRSEGVAKWKLPWQNTRLKIIRNCAGRGTGGSYSPRMGCGSSVRHTSSILKQSESTCWRYTQNSKQKRLFESAQTEKNSLLVRFSNFSRVTFGVTLVEFIWKDAEMCESSGRYLADAMLYYKVIFYNQKSCSEKGCGMSWKSQRLEWPYSWKTWVSDSSSQSISGSMTGSKKTTVSSTKTSRNKMAAPAVFWLIFKPMGTEVWLSHVRSCHRTRSRRKRLAGHNEYQLYRII